MRRKKIYYEICEEMTIKGIIERLRILKNGIKREIEEKVYNYYAYDNYKQEFLKAARIIKVKSKSQSTKLKINNYLIWVYNTENKINNKF